MLCSEIVFLGMIYHFMLMFGYGDYCMMLVCLATNILNASVLSNGHLLFFIIISIRNSSRLQIV